MLLVGVVLMALPKEVGHQARRVRAPAHGRRCGGPAFHSRGSAVQRISPRRRTVASTSLRSLHRRRHIQWTSSPSESSPSSPSVTTSSSSNHLPPPSPTLLLPYSLAILFICGMLRAALADVPELEPSFQRLPSQHTNSIPRDRPEPTPPVSRTHHPAGPP